MKAHHLCNTPLVDADFHSHQASRTFWIRNLGMAKIIPSMSGRQNDRIDASALGRAHALTPVAFHRIEEMPQHRRGQRA